LYQFGAVKGALPPFPPSLALKTCRMLSKAGGPEARQRVGGLGPRSSGRAGGQQGQESNGKTNPRPRMWLRYLAVSTFLEQRLLEREHYRMYGKLTLAVLAD